MSFSLKINCLNFFGILLVNSQCPDGFSDKIDSLGNPISGTGQCYPTPEIAQVVSKVTNFFSFFNI